MDHHDDNDAYFFLLNDFGNVSEWDWPPHLRHLNEVNIDLRDIPEPPPIRQPTNDQAEEGNHNNVVHADEPQPLDDRQGQGNDEIGQGQQPVGPPNNDRLREENTDAVVVAEPQRPLPANNDQQPEGGNSEVVHVEQQASPSSNDQSEREGSDEVANQEQGTPPHSSNEQINEVVRVKQQPAMPPLPPSDHQRNVVNVLPQLYVLPSDPTETPQVMETIEQVGINECHCTYAQRLRKIIESLLEVIGLEQDLKVPMVQDLVPQSLHQLCKYSSDVTKRTIEKIVKSVGRDKVPKSPEERGVQFSLSERINGWSVGRYQRPNDERWDTFYRKEGVRRMFRSINEVVKFILFEIRLAESKKAEKRGAEDDSAESSSKKKMRTSPHTEQQSSSGDGAAPSAETPEQFLAEAYQNLGSADMGSQY